jgi:hypothetical protein
MGVKRSVVFAAAAIHLTVAALFCTHVPIERDLPAPLQRALAIYAGLTGVPTHFNFFAPVVAPQARADFVLVDGKGATRQVRLETPNSEANQRLAMMFTFTGDERVRAYLMRAWSMYFLERHPDARAVEARLEILKLPTHAQAREGVKPAWVEFDRIVTRREDNPAR